MTDLADAQTPARPTATGAVFEAILADIVRGTYPPGARLPAERDLSRKLGASRPTLREALRRLAEWSLVESRRGSGVVVRPIEEWSIEVIPAYLRYGRPGPEKPAVPALVTDLLALRRGLLLEIARLIAGRIPPGGTEPAREAAQKAWDARDDRETFPELDLKVMRIVVEAAGLYPALWLLNRVAGVYLDIARTLTAVFPPPEDYLAFYESFFSALEAGDARAGDLLSAYLERHDRRLLGALGAPAEGELR